MDGSLGRGRGGAGDVCEAGDARVGGAYGLGNFTTILRFVVFLGCREKGADESAFTGEARKITFQLVGLQATSNETSENYSHPVLGSKVNDSATS